MFNTRPRFTRAAILRVTCPLLLLGACAGQGPTKTGFLSSYDGMQATQKHSADRIRVDPAYVPQAYTKVILEPVSWRPTPDAPQRDPKVVHELTEDFQKSLSETLGKDFRIVSAEQAEASGSGVLRVRSAITNTRRANWYLNAPAMLMLRGPSVNPGGASEEIEVLDASTGRSLIAIATYNNGMPWNVLGNFQAYGHARRAFARAAELLRDEIKAGRTDAPAPATS